MVKTTNKNMKNRAEVTQTKEVKDLYVENYKILIKQLKMIQRNGKLFHTLGL